MKLHFHILAFITYVFTILVFCPLKTYGQDSVFAEDDLINEDFAANLGGGFGGEDLGFDMSDFDMAQLEAMSQMGGQHFEPNTKQTKYLTCPVCKLLVEHSLNAYRELRATQPTRKFLEIEVDEFIEPICDPFEGLGQWLENYIINVEDHPTKPNRAIYVVDKVEESFGCMEDCYTLGDKCINLLGLIGPELVVQLWKDDLTLEEMQTKICTEEMSDYRGSCGRKQLSFKKTKEDL